MEEETFITENGVFKYSSTGLKFDKEKNKLNLIPPCLTEEVGKVLTHGSNKYGDYNWLNGIKYSRISGAYRRHLLEFEKGNEIDDESGLPHLAHAITNIMFLLHYSKNDEFKKNDDRKFKVD